MQNTVLLKNKVSNTDVCDFAIFCLTIGLIRTDVSGNAGLILFPIDDYF